MASCGRLAPLPLPKPPQTSLRLATSIPALLPPRHRSKSSISSPTSNPVDQSISQLRHHNSTASDPATPSGAPSFPSPSSSSSSSSIKDTPPTMGDVGGGILGGICGAFCGAICEAIQWTFCSTSQLGSNWACCDSCCRCRCCWKEGALPVEDYPNGNSPEDPNGQAKQLAEQPQPFKANNEASDDVPPPEYRPTEQMHVVAPN
ncbi:hypothetical protein ACQY0O_005920 [Thecaphora frezii]